MLKYQREFDQAVASCGAELTAQFLSERKTLFLHPDELEASAERVLRVRRRGQMLNGSMLQRGRSIMQREVAQASGTAQEGLPGRSPTA